MNQNSVPLRVLTAGLGNMGRSHALAYHRHPGFEIVGLVNRTQNSSKLVAAEFGIPHVYTDWQSLVHDRASITISVGGLRKGEGTVAGNFAN